MRRLITLIIMLVIPLQFAWAAAASLHGHLGENVAMLGAYAHDHHHHHHEHGQSGHDASGDTDKNHSEDGQHDTHCHPVFSSIIMESGLSLGLCLSGGPLPHPPEVFYSRIPPLLDRPPLARA
ncbi:MAG: hypothetical protein ACLGH6_02590 [Gammaproteobacteria bacterium]